MACAPSENSDQPGHPPSLIRVFAVCMKKSWILSYPLSAQCRLWSDWVDAQADLSLRWANRSVCWFCHEVAHLEEALTIKKSNNELQVLCRKHHTQKHMRRPGIEPGSQEWESCMIPLHQRRFVVVHMLLSLFKMIARLCCSYCTDSPKAGWRSKARSPCAPMRVRIQKYQNPKTNKNNIDS